MATGKFNYAVTRVIHAITFPVINPILSDNALTLNPNHCSAVHDCSHRTILRLR